MTENNVARALRAARRMFSAGKELEKLIQFSMVPIIGEVEKWEKLKAANLVVNATYHHFKYALEWLGATTDLCERGQNSAAGVVLRSLMEVAYRGVWINLSHENAERRARSFAEYCSALADNAIAVHGPKVATGQDFGKPKDSRAIIKKNRGDFESDSYCIPFYKMLDEIGVEERYKTHYAFFSANVHGQLLGNESTPRVSWTYALEAANRFVPIARTTAEVFEVSKEFNAIYADAQRAVDDAYIVVAETMGIEYFRGVDGTLMMVKPPVRLRKR